MTNTANNSEIIKKVLTKFNSDKTKMLDILRDVQQQLGCLSDASLSEISKQMKISRVDVEGPATFYHFFTKTSRGQYTVYLNKSATSYLKGYEAVAQAFEKEVACKFEENSKDGKIGLYTTSCIGMCDQEPAALINDVVFVNLTAAKVKTIVDLMKKGSSVQEMVKTFGDGQNANALVKAEVQNNIRLKGPVFFSDYTPGEALKKALALPSLDVIEEVKKSNLRGRGGAGFPTGMKWGFCRATESSKRYVMCNVDEGEPGTFKDRVLLTEKPELVFEGMAIAGFAIEAQEGVVYLRGEYMYLKNYLENVLDNLRKKNLLGKNILGSPFSFDISIKMGAGAYICGEESALIESAEGKRGQPRNRPPFPVSVGYNNLPTTVNNPETYGCATKILLNGADWFKKMGTVSSAGVKLLSVAGDVEKPGIYEIEFGKTIQDVLNLAGAKETQAVLVGGPSGQFLNPSQFSMAIAFEGAATGGAFTVFNKSRNLLEVVHNYMEFFVEESCGFCVPCRAGNVLLTKTLEKIIHGFGTTKDLKDMDEWGQITKMASRCGLGQTSPNPVTSTLKNFKEVYMSKVRSDVDFIPQFDLSAAVADSCEAVNRDPHQVQGH